MDHAAIIADLLDLVPVGPEARADLVARMSGPDRHYHDIGHLALLWDRHRRHGTGLTIQDPPWHRLIACAIAFHDAVYNPARRDNEARSAELWRASAPALEPWEIDWVAGTILATANHLAAAPEPGMPPDALEARVWMLDLDFTPLGESEAVFRVNTEHLRLEYAHMDDDAWIAGRLAFLGSLARRPALFRTPILAALFEAQARKNLAAELEITRRPG